MLSSLRASKNSFDPPAKGGFHISSGQGSYINLPLDDETIAIDKGGEERQNTAPESPNWRKDPSAKDIKRLPLKGDYASDMTISILDPRLEQDETPMIQKEQPKNRYSTTIRSSVDQTRQSGPKLTSLIAK